MKYELKMNLFDFDALNLDNGGIEGNIDLYSTESLVEETNKIRKAQGNEDLVGLEYDNDVYYNFYLMFNTEKNIIQLKAVCNYGKNDDEVWYDLPLSQEEERETMLFLIKCLSETIYYDCY